MRTQAMLLFGMVFLASTLCLPLATRAAENAEQHSVILRILSRPGVISAEHQQAFQEQMTEKYTVQIELQIDYVENNDNDAFFLAAQHQTHDIINPSHETLKRGKFALIPEDLVLPIDRQRLPLYPHLNRCLKHLNMVWKDGQLYALPMAAVPLGFIVHTLQSGQPPDSWQAFWDEHYTGKFAIARDDAVGNASIAALALGVPADRLAPVLGLHTAQLQTRLTTLAKQAHHIWSGQETLYGLDGCLLRTTRGGLPLEQAAPTWVRAKPREGDLGWIDVWALTHALDDKPRATQLAEEWLNFFLTPPVQLRLMRQLGHIPVIEGLAQAASPEEIAHFGLDDPQFFVKRFIPYPSLAAATESALELLWQTALDTAAQTSQESQ